MNRTTHYTPRIRKDVARELNEDILALSVNAHVPGALEFARRESARRDSMTTAKGAQKRITEILTAYASAQGVALENMSAQLCRTVFYALASGTEIDLPLWLEISREVDAEFGDAKGELTRYESKSTRIDAEGRKTVATLSVQF